MPRYIFLILISLFCAVNSSIAQRLTFVQGDLIVQLRQGADIRDFIKTHERYDGQRTDLKIGQMLSKPLNIWQLKFDDTRIPYRRFIFQLQKDH